LIKLKPISIVFIISQILDFVTTAIAFSIQNVQFVESNHFVHLFGWIPVTIFKFLATIGIVLVFEKIKIIKICWIVPSISMAIPVWNVFIIILTLLYVGVL